MGVLQEDMVEELMFLANEHECGVFGKIRRINCDGVLRRIRDGIMMSVLA